MKKILVVGAGFSGSVIARQLAENGFSVDVIDKRNHIAGNAFDRENEIGIRVHDYGPHLFHTNDMKVVDWLSKFTDWVPYQHKVKAMLSDGQLVTLPVNKETAQIVGSENIIDTFFRPYSLKMWGKSIEELDPDILSRVAVRDDYNDLYFPNDAFQALPKFGYTSLISNILSHESIVLHLNTEFSRSMESEYDHVFNCMPIDEYFNFVHGELPYRSIKFHSITLPISRLFPVGVVNFTNDLPYTRITEWKNFPMHGEKSPYTTLTYEEPCDYRDNNNERYYPVKDIHGLNRELYNKYKAMTPDNVTFAGRCGLYVYIDMHQAVSISLSQVSAFISTVR